MRSICWDFQVFLILKNTLIANFLNNLIQSRYLSLIFSREKKHKHKKPKLCTVVSVFFVSICLCISFPTVSLLVILFGISLTNFLVSEKQSQKVSNFWQIKLFLLGFKFFFSDDEAAMSVVVGDRWKLDRRVF